MLRITELRLPLEHAESALEQAILKKLDIGKSALIAISVFNRSYDARKKFALLFCLVVRVMKKKLLLILVVTFAINYLQKSMKLLQCLLIMI